MIHSLGSHKMLNRSGVLGIRNLNGFISGSANLIQREAPLAEHEQERTENKFTIRFHDTLPRLV